MMIELNTAEHPFLKAEFEKMSIPGNERGFAISYNNESKTECIACGLVGNSAIFVSYSGEEFAVKTRHPISMEDFESLCRALPDVAKRSVAIFEDMLDGEGYMVKWLRGNEKTQLMLCNPRCSEDQAVKQLASRLDSLMNKARKAKMHSPRVKGSIAGSPVSQSFTGN
jgi:hypothetical protein